MQKVDILNSVKKLIMITIIGTCPDEANYFECGESIGCVECVEKYMNNYNKENNSEITIEKIELFLQEMKEIADFYNDYKKGECI